MNRQQITEARILGWLSESQAEQARAVEQQRLALTPDSPELPSRRDVPCDCRTPDCTDRFRGGTP